MNQNKITDAYQIIVTSEKSYMDDNISIVIKGKPSQRLSLFLSTDDLYSINGDIRIMEVGSRWESTIPVQLNEQGKVELDARIFTSLKLRKQNKSGVEQDLKKLSENRSCHITLQLSFNENVVAKKVLERCFCDETVKSEDIISEKLLGRYFSTKNKTNLPAIIVVSGSDGRIEKAQAIAQCLARRGFAALAVCYFGMNLVPDDLDRIPLEYIENAITWLKEREEVDNERIGIYGRSKGGEFVLLAASIFPDLKFVIANTPSVYVHEGIIGGRKTSRHSSWTYHNEEIPFLKASIPNLISLVWGMIRKNQFAMRHYYEHVTWKREGKLQAKINLENNQARFLLIGSDTDAIWPSDRYVKEAEQMIQQQNQGHVRSYIYQQSGHMLTLPYQPIPNCVQYGGTLEMAVPATIDQWNRVITFLEEQK